MPNSPTEEKLAERVIGARGMNDRLHPQYLPNDLWFLLENVDLGEPGVIKKRKGKKIPTNFGSTLGSFRVRALQEFQPEGGTKVLLMVAGTTAYSWDGSGARASITGTLTTDLQTEIVPCLNRAFFLNGTDNVFSWSGSGALLDEGNTNADPPRSKFGVYHLNRLFLSGNTTNPTYVWFSNTLDPQTFDRAVNVFKFGEGSGQSVTGLASFRNFECIVFLSKSIEVLITDGATPLTDWERRVLEPRIGCASHGTIQAIGEDIYFMDQEGHVRSLNRTLQDASQGATSIPISEPITETINSLNKAKLGEAQARVFDNKYILSVVSGGSSVPDTMLVYDILAGGWSKWTSLDVARMAISDVESTGTLKLYGGQSAATGKVWQLLVNFNDDGSAISFKAQSKAFDMQAPELEKLFTELEVRANSTSIDNATVNAQVDFQGYQLLGTFSMLGNAPALPIALPFNLAAFGEIHGKFHLESLNKGRTIQFEITQATADVEIELKGLSVFALPDNYEYE